MLRAFVLASLATSVLCCTQARPANPPPSSGEEETVAAPEPIDIKRVPVAQSEPDTVAQIAAAAPGKGWFCFDTRSGETKATSICERALAKCQEARTDHASAFGSISGVSYGACTPRAHAYCFVVRVHAEFVPPDLQTTCSEELSECNSMRAVFVKNANMEVGGVCARAD